MADELANARVAVQRASEDSDNATVREQLDSIDRGLMELSESESTLDNEPHGDRLEEVEEKIVGLMDETDGSAHTRLGDARDSIDANRRRYTREWDKRSAE